MLNKIKVIAGTILFITSLPFYLFTIPAFFLTTVIGYSGDVGSEIPGARALGAVLLLLNCGVTWSGFKLMQKPIKKSLVGDQKVEDVTRGKT